MTAVINGLRGELIRVEIDVAPGLPVCHIVGLPDAALSEARERVRAAIRNSGFECLHVVYEWARVRPWARSRISDVHPRTHRMALAASRSRRNRARSSASPRRTVTSRRSLSNGASR